MIQINYTPGIGFSQSQISGNPKIVHAKEHNGFIHFFTVGKSVHYDVFSETEIEILKTMEDVGYLGKMELSNVETV